MSEGSGCAGGALYNSARSWEQQGGQEGCLPAMLEPALLYSLTKSWYGLVRLPSV